MENRLENNLECLKVLERMAEKFPDWRFMQLLFNVGLCEDRFYEEPSVTLQSLKEQYEMFKTQEELFEENEN